MNQDLLNFFEDISKDEEKLKKLFSYEDIDKMYEFALSESKGDFTKKEFEEGLNAIINLSESIRSGEISKEDLESGEVDDEILSTVSGGAEETPLRSGAMIFAAAVPLVITAAQFIVTAIRNKKANKARKAFEESKMGKLMAEDQEAQLLLNITKNKEELKKRFNNQTK